MKIMIKRFKNWLAAKCRAFAFWLDGVKYSVHVVDTTDAMALRHYAQTLDGVRYSVYVVDTSNPDALRRYAEKLDGIRYKPEFELREVFIDRSNLQRFTMDFTVVEDELQRVRQQMAYADESAINLRIDQVAQRLLLEKLSKSIIGTRELADAAVIYKDDSPEGHYRGLYKVALNLWVEQNERPLTNFIARQVVDDYAEMKPFKRTK